MVGVSMNDAGSSCLEPGPQQPLILTERPDSQGHSRAVSCAPGRRSTPFLFQQLTCKTLLLPFHQSCWLQPLSVSVAQSSRCKGETARALRKKKKKSRISSSPQPAQRRDGPKPTRPLPFVCAHEINVLMLSTNQFDSF